MSGRFKLAVVVPRYGSDVNGGAEVLARQYATRLAEVADVTVLTTCALDYRTWADHYPPGRTVADGVEVIRFSVPVPRDEAAFDALSLQVLTGPPSSDDEEAAWMEAQGPISPELERHLSEHGTNYDAVLFIPYLYATTARGLPLVADRAVLVPAMHDEPPLRLRIFDRIVGGAQRVIFSTPEERELGRRRFGVDDDRARIVGAGIDIIPTRRTGATPRRASRPYVIAVGRIDPSKGSDRLIATHARYREMRPEGLDLMMVGRSVMDIPQAPWLDCVGFVSDEDKQALISGAVALVSASPYESLSLVLFESWAEGTPTLVATASDVLVGQTRRAGGGLWFRDAHDYVAALDLLTARPAVANALGASGRQVARALTWDVVTDRLIEAIPGMPRRVTADDVPDARRTGAAVTAVPATAAAGAVAHLGTARATTMLMGVGRGTPQPGIAWIDPDDPALADRLSVIDAVIDGDPALTDLARAVGIPVIDLDEWRQAT